jgi:hypothetical protein
MAENNLPPGASPDDTVRPDTGGWISGPCDDADAGTPQLDAALPAARELLASTVEAVNPGTSRSDLFGYVTEYRKHLADLVAACSGAWISPPVRFDEIPADEVRAGDQLLLDDGVVAEVEVVAAGDFWLGTRLHGPGLAIDWQERRGTASGTLFRTAGDFLCRVRAGAR